MRYFLRIYHIVFSLILIYTLGFLLFHSPDIVNFLSYASNLVSILVVGLFIYLAFNDKKKHQKESFLRGSSVVYTVSIAIAFALLIDNVSGIIMYPWISFIQHRLIPVAVVVEWIINPPRQKFILYDTFKWLIAPTVYFFYTLIRGSVVNWYPYPFFNPHVKGYLEVFVYFLCLMAGLWLISLVTIFIGNKLNKAQE